MGLREINIPFGPDKTGGIGFGVLADKSDPDGVRDPFAPSVPNEYENDAASYDAARASVPPINAGPAEWTSWQGIPANTQVAVPSVANTQGYDTQGYDTAAFSELITADDEELESTSRRNVVQRSSEVQPVSETFQNDFEDFDDLDDLEEHDRDDVQMSFAALKSSFGQSRELKTKERDAEKFREQLEDQRQELEDREYILENYEMLVSEQNHIINECTRQREADKDELAHIVAQLEEVTAELANAQAYYDEQMQPLQTEIGRAHAAADQAKNDERSRKSELNAAEAEVRRAATPNDKAMAQAKYDHVKQAYDQACAISSDAQDHLNELNRINEDAMHQIEQTEGPLKHAIEDLKHDEEELKDIIAQLGEDISVARKRLQYCDGVKQFPEETEKLRSSVALDEEELREIEEDLEFLTDQLKENKAKALKAKIALGVGIAVVVIFVVVLFVIFGR